MALRRASNDKRAGDGDGAPAGPVDKVGESVEECVALGQALIEAGHLPGEMLQPALADGKGDLGELHLVRSGPERRSVQQLAQSLQ